MKNLNANFQELRRLLPGGRFNFVEVNVRREELQAVRAQHVRHLLHPLNTVLDDSIGQFLELEPFFTDPPILVIFFL